MIEETPYIRERDEREADTLSPRPNDVDKREKKERQKESGRESLYVLALLIGLYPRTLNKFGTRTLGRGAHYDADRRIKSAGGK